MDLKLIKKTPVVLLTLSVIVAFLAFSSKKTEIVKKSDYANDPYFQNVSTEEQDLKPVKQSMAITEIIGFDSRAGIPYSKIQVCDWLARNQLLHSAKTYEKIYGVPASVLLAQWMLESNLGKSSLTNETKNDVNIKCFKNHNHKTHGCVKKYDNIENSRDYYMSFKVWWEGRSKSVKLLISYKQTKKLISKDYKVWAKAIHDSPYATDPNYDTKLIKRIQAYGLNNLDFEKCPDTVINMSGVVLFNKSTIKI